MMFPDSGLVVGPSHSDGGVYASVANGPDVELEGGEFIINKEATEDFLPLIKQINDIGRMEQMGNANNAQNAHSAIDALIASASTLMMPGGGMVAPKTPMYREGGITSNERVKRYIKEGIPFDDTIDASNYTINLAEVDNETGKNTYNLYDARTGENLGKMFDLESGTLNVSNRHPSLQNSDSPNWSMLEGKVNPGSEFNQASREGTLKKPTSTGDILATMNPDGTLEIFSNTQNQKNKKSIDPNLARLAQRIDMYNRMNREETPIRDVTPAMTAMPELEEVGILSEDMMGSNMMSLRDVTPSLEQPSLRDKPKKLRPTIRSRISSALENLLGTAALESTLTEDQMNRTVMPLRDVTPDLARPEITLQPEVEPLESIKQTASEEPVAFDKNNFPIYDKASNKAQSFRDAFRTARREGKDIFSWDGRSYTTELKKQLGGMIQYEEGGPLHSRRMFNQGTGFDKKKSDLDKDGKISEYEKKRGMAIAKSMKNQMQMGGMIGMQQPMMQRPMNPAMNLSPMQRMGNNMPPMMYQEGGSILPSLNTLRNIRQGAMSALENVGIENLRQTAMDTLMNMDTRPQIEKDLFQFAQPVEVKGPQTYGPPAPRKQKEMRQKSSDLDELLKGLVIEVNPFTGDTITEQSIKEELERIRRRVEQSKKPNMQEGGMISGNNLMGAMANDRRVAALQPDVYSSRMQNGMTGAEAMVVPKLSEAILPAYGIETPLSKRQSAMLNKNAVSPSALNPNVKGLVNRLLVQRLANETT